MSGAPRFSPRRPAVGAALLLALGVSLAAWVPEPTVRWVLCSGLLVAVLVVTMLIRRSAWWCIPVLIAAGVTRMWLATAVLEPGDIRNADIPRERVVIHGRVDTEPDVRPHLTHVVLALDSVQSTERTSDASGLVLVRFQYNPAVQVDDQLSIRGRLISPESARNPGQFDYAIYLARRGIHRQLVPAAWAPLAGRTSAATPGWTRSVVSPLRARLKQVLYGHISGEPASLVWGLLFGEKQEMSPRTLTAFEQTGTLHLLAVSGSNVGVVIAVIWGLLTTVRARGRIRLVLVMVGVVLFCQLAHNEASVVRASVAALLVLAGRAAGRPAEPLNVWGGSLLILLLYDPQQLFNVGFQLSYLATLGILLIMPLCHIARTASWPVRATHMLRAALAVSLAAQLATLPILAAVFHRVPLITPVSNLLCVPLAGLVTAAGVVTLLLAPCGEPLGSVLAGVTWLCARALEWAVLFFADLRWPLWEAASPGWLQTSVYVAAMLLLIMFARNSPQRRRVVLIALFLCAGLSWGSGGRREYCEIVVLDTRDAGCSLLRWPNGEVWQIDERSPDRPQRRRRLVRQARLELAWPSPARRIQLGDALITSCPNRRVPALSLYVDGEHRIAAVELSRGTSTLIWLDDAARLSDSALCGRDWSVIVCPGPVQRSPGCRPPQYYVSTGRRKGSGIGPADSSVQVLHTRTHGSVAIRLWPSAVRLKPTIR